MALIRISELPSGDSDISPNDVVPFVDNETQRTKKLSIKGLEDYFNVQGLIDSAIGAFDPSGDGHDHDSAKTQAQIDSALANYEFAYWDSAKDYGMISDTVDSAWVRARQAFSAFDSAEVQQMIDSAMITSLDASPTGGTTDDF